MAGCLPSRSWQYITVPDSRGSPLEGRASLGRQLADPDVAETERRARITMRLQLDGRGRVGPVDRLSDVERLAGEDRCVLDQDTVVEGRHLGRRPDLAVGREGGG